MVFETTTLAHTGGRSGGPKTAEGIDRCKRNAHRHGLRSLEVVVPGEDLDAWEAYRAAVVDDLDPAGALETALAEQAAAKLWRLGRVACHEADLIANGQDPDELARAHGVEHRRMVGLDALKPSGIPVLEDVRSSRREAAEARGKVEKRSRALEQLEGLSAMGDGDALPSWDLYEVLRDSLRFKEKEQERLFADEEGEGPFLARHARAMLSKHGEPSEVAVAMVGIWRERAQEDESQARKAERHHKSMTRRYRVPSSEGGARTACPRRPTWTASRGTRRTWSGDSTRPWSGSAT
jgi:hypothetical protein